MDLTINYENGFMVIHLDEFLGCGSIGKFKKLMKLIRLYGDGTEIPKILSIVDEFNAEYEIKQKLNASMITGYTAEIKFTESLIKNLVSNRSKHKKSSDDWTHYNEQVKEQREELRHLKSCLARANADLKRNEKLKKFYEKVLEVTTDTK